MILSFWANQEKLQEFLTSLAPVVTLLNFNGSSEVEVNEKKDCVHDALNVTRIVVEKSIIP